jgi:hypothetical protein
MDSSVRILRWSVASALVGLLLIYNSVDASSTAPPPAAAAPVAGGAAKSSSVPKRSWPGGRTAPSGPAMGRSRPVRLQIPQIAVNAPFTKLKLNRSGVLEPPSADDPNLVGWYGGGVTPGERGPAIVAGHVDTTTGPAVFLLLRMLATGDTVDITRADGTVATFVVDDVETYNKDGFPDRAVYGDTPDAQLRLITCGGTYDHARGYLSNVVVFAHLDSYRRG